MHIEDDSDEDTNSEELKEESFMISVSTYLVMTSVARNTGMKGASDEISGEHVVRR